MTLPIRAPADPWTRKLRAEGLVLAALSGMFLLVAALIFGGVVDTRSSPAVDGGFALIAGLATRWLAIDCLLKRSVRPPVFRSTFSVVVRLGERTDGVERRRKRRTTPLGRSDNRA